VPIVTQRSVYDRIGNVVAWAALGVLAAAAIVARSRRA
jgi:apolipoprotein N-acyltransferase